MWIFKICIRGFDFDKLIYVMQNNLNKLIIKKIIIIIPCYLQQSMWGNFYYHSIIRHKVQSLLKEHRADQVIDMVLCRWVERQWALPVFLWDGRADPACWTKPWAFYYLEEHTQEVSVYLCWGFKMVMSSRGHCETAVPHQLTFCSADRRAGAIEAI